MKKSYYESLEKMRDNIKHFREKYYSFNKKLIGMDSRRYDSLKDLQENIDSGRFHLDLEGNLFECFFHHNKDKKPRYLYVFYSGARIPPEKSSHEQDKSLHRYNRTDPLFRRWGYYSLIDSLDGMILLIDDPMILQYDDLLLGWYYGDKEKSLCALSLEIVKSVERHFNISRENIIFFGSSGGGYASIYAASLLDGTLAIALNPQVYIQSFQQTKAFERITGFDLHAPDSLHRNDPAYMIRNSSSKFCVIYNQQSTFDMFYQMLPLCEELGVEPRYGIIHKDNFLLWVYDAKGAPLAHSAWETRSIFCSVDYIAKAFHEDRLSDGMEDMAFMVNEFWHDLYEERATIAAIRKKMPDLKL